MEEQPATNLSEVAADTVSLWNAASKRWVEVRDIFVEKAQITSPVEVSVPVMDEIDTYLAYPNANSKQVPALDGILAYIAQQKLGGAGVTNKYFSVRRKNYFTYEGDTHVTKKAVSLQVVRRPVFMDVFAPTFVTKKILRQKIVRPTIIYSENAGPM